MSWDRADESARKRRGRMIYAPWPRPIRPAGFAVDEFRTKHRRRRHRRHRRVPADGPLCGAPEDR